MMGSGIVQRGGCRVEAIGPVKVLVYRTLTADGVELAVTRLEGGAAGDRGVPVVLMAGTFCQRSFWVSPRGIGLGPYLRDRGFDVWILEPRGHGLSPKDSRYRRWSAEDQLEYDLPAVQGLVDSQTGRSAHWVGHSWGGLAIVASLAAGWLDSALVRAGVVLGANISAGDIWIRNDVLRGLVWTLLTVVGGVPARAFRLGPESESRAYVLDFVRWKRPGGRWETLDGRSYWEGVREIEEPLLAIAAAADTSDPEQGCRELYDALGSPDKRYLLLGRETGFSHDYGHVEMIVGRQAPQEVWPEIACWLEGH